MARRKSSGPDLMNVPHVAPPKRRGRPPGSKNKPKREAAVDGGHDAVPDVYSSDHYREYLEQVDRNTSDLNAIQADRRELFKAERNRGLVKAADTFVRSLRAKVRNDDMTLRDAQEIIDLVNTYWDWSGLPLALAEEQRGRQDELATEPAV